MAEKMATDIKPTPTQDENDRAAMGEHVVDKEHDGSPYQPPDVQSKESAKHAEAEKPARGTYATRAVQANEAEAAHPAARHRRGE